MKTLSHYNRWTRGWFVMLLATITLGFWATPCKQQPAMAALTLGILAFFLYLNNRPILTVITVLVLLTQWSLLGSRGTCKPYIAASWLAGLTTQSGGHAGKASNQMSNLPASKLFNRPWEYAKTQAEWMNDIIREEGGLALETVITAVRPVAEGYESGDTSDAEEQENCWGKKCRY